MKLKKIMSAAVATAVTASMVAMTGISASAANEIVVWEGEYDLGKWAAAQSCTLSNIPEAEAGGTITIEYTVSEKATEKKPPQIQIVAKVGSSWVWTTFMSDPVEEDDVYTLPMDDTTFSFQITEEQAGYLREAKELLFQGQYATITKYTYTPATVIEYGEETTIWEGSEALNGWENVVNLAETGIAGAEEKGYVTINYTATAAYPQIQLAAGTGDDGATWTVIKSADGSDWFDVSSDGTSYKLILTAEQAETLANAKFLYAKGQNATLTSVTYTGLKQASDEFEYIIKNDGTVEITGYTGNDTQLEIPNKINGKSVTSIGYFAFYSRSLLESITIPDSVTTIENYAFYRCSLLESITIPDSVTSIGVSAFFYCESLESVTIGDSVTSIGGYAFSSCNSLENITVPASVKSIGEYAFGWCDYLKSINVDSQNERYSSVDGVLFNKDGTQLITYPDGKTAQSYTVPDSVTEIWAYAFAHNNKIKNVTLPDGLISIGKGAFYECDSLGNITVPASVENIGKNAFRWCHYLKSINVDSQNENYSSVDGVLFNKEVTQLIAYPSGKTAQSYTVPESVTEICDHAFAYNYNIKNITLPEDLIIVGEEAFYHCLYLKSVIIPDKVTDIGERAFKHCSDISYLELGKSLKTIGEEAFCGCSSLTELVIPDGVESIGYGAFLECGNLKNVTIPESVKTLGKYSFGYEYEFSTVAGKLYDGLTIYCALNSAAYDYAVENGISYEIIGQEPQPEPEPNPEPVKKDDDVPDTGRNDDVFSAPAIVCMTAAAMVVLKKKNQKTAE